MAKKQTRSSVGNITSERDVVLGNQTNITLNADLERVERLLLEIIALLREPHTAVRVEQDGHGHITIVGDGNTVRVTPEDVTRFAALQPSATSQRREEIYLTRYILGETYARWTHLYLPLAGQLLEAPLRLTDRADQGVSAAGLPLSDIREAVTRFNKTRLVILGDPGAGKTTTLHRLALDLARERLRDPAHGKLPLRVDLFNFIGKDQLPADFLRAQWETTGLDETFGAALARGQVCLLLDGVNQMPLVDRSARIERWAAWANSDADLPAGNWAVFTCRSADYVTDLRLPEVRVQSLDPDRMKRYFQLRFPAEVADQHWHTFEQRLRSGDDRFERLARNPFMLALLADRAAEGLSLHVSRATLMDDLAERRIKHELTLGRQPESLTADPRGTAAATLEALARLAFILQTQGEGTRFTRASVQGVALAGTGQLRLTLDDVINLGVSATLLDVAEGAGETAVYRFYHHLLQEYFAARELLRRFRAGQRLRRHWRVSWRWWQLWSRPLLPGVRLPPPPVTGWEETVVMTAGLAGKDAARFIRAVQDGNLPLAGRCLAEAGTDREDLKPLAETVRRDLLTRQRTVTGWLQRPHLRARIDAGLALGEVGHPDLTPQKYEFEGRTVWAIAPPMHDIPAGEFRRGSDPTDKRAFSDEYTTERAVTLPAFRMGRYPVTNAEFRFFIENGGYANDRWWSEAGQKWKEGG